MNLSLYCRALIFLEENKDLTVTNWNLLFQRALISEILCLMQQVTSF
jgi:hypothetical protein